MYQILYSREDGTNFVQECHSTDSKNRFLEILNNSGIEYTVVERDPKKWALAKVVFDLQLIDAAKKAVKENEDLYGLYTFGDPNKITKKDKVAKVKCTDGKIKNAYVVDVCLATAEEIAEFKKKIGYTHLGLVVGEV